MLRADQLAICAFTMILPTAFSHPGIEEALSVKGRTVAVMAGDYLLLGEPIRIEEDANIGIPPSHTALVEDEALKLPDVEPSGYWSGAMLAGPRTFGLNALGSFIGDSLIARDAMTERVLVFDKDYRVSAPFGLLGLGPETELTPRHEVLVSYKYHLQRVDSIGVDAYGKPFLAPGMSVLALPTQALMPMGARRIANVYRPYGSTDVLPEHLYPIVAAPGPGPKTSRGRIPHTLEKLKLGEAVTIVCMGDSITAGGDASTPGLSYVGRVTSGLRERFPDADITVINAGVGGSRLNQWFTPDDSSKKGACFTRVEEARPDLVTVEFLNDLTLDPGAWPGLYEDLLLRVTALGAELLVITPSFAHAAIMKADSLSVKDQGTFVPLVNFLYDFVEKHGLACADVSGRWDHLRLEGIPFMTYLLNQYNHPDDRGHALYADEVLRCFE